MIALIFEFTLFFLVLFFVVPGLFITLKVLRSDAYQQRHPAGGRLLPPT
jgi:hypothetical protein